MRLSKEAIKEFKEIYYKEFGEKISDQEAQEMGGNLISLFKIIYHPIPGAGKRNPEDKNNKCSGPV
ncbi:MAG: hypothetical protein J7M30_11300 [Deltaproteobacteria bacterium]|nr:hypothetical protein [Deltaproteobacteria bacterium]